MFQSLAKIFKFVFDYVFTDVSQKDIHPSWIIANHLKGSQLLSDYDILTTWLKYSPEDAKEAIARMKIQKLEELKLQVMAQNPIVMGVSIPNG